MLSQGCEPAKLEREDSGKGSIDPEIDPLTAALKVLSVSSLRDVTYLMGLAERSSAGSPDLLDTVIPSIAADWDSVEAARRHLRRP